MKKRIMMLDVDDVLMPYIPILCELLSEQEGIYFTEDDVTEWCFTNLSKGLQEKCWKLMSTEAIHDLQKPFPGAVNFVEQLIARDFDVCIGTAVDNSFMATRGEQIQKFFPMIPKSNLIMGKRKDVFYSDFMLDDSFDNISSSISRYPVLFRKPWNTRSSVPYAVSSYEEFLALIDRIDDENRKIVCLVGPSASGKTAICEELMKEPGFVKPISTTSRGQRPDDEDNSYNFWTREEFQRGLAAGLFIEHSEYAGNYYGLTIDAMRDTLVGQNTVIVPIDIVGAKNLVRVFGERVRTVYVNRNRTALVEAIMNRQVTEEIKQARISSIDMERENMDRCQWIINNNGTIQQAVQQLKTILQ